MYIELLFEFGLGLVNDLSLYIFGLTCGSRHRKWISNDVLCVLQPAARVPVSVLSSLVIVVSQKRGKQNEEYWLKPVNRMVSERKPPNILTK